MEIEEIREYCLKKPAVEERFPFDLETLVFKVGGKIFLLIPLEKQPLQFSAKNLPEENEKLREEFPQISGAWHMNKRHWNTVICESLRRDLIFRLIDDSYHLVIGSLPKKLQAQLFNS